MKRGKKRKATRIQSFLFNKKILNSKRSNSHFDFIIRNNILSKSKRSQANLITVVLIVLLVIVSLVIIWNLIQPLVKRTTERIDVGAVAVDVEIDESAIQLGDVSNITIKRGSGKGNITALRFVFTNGAEEYVFTNYAVVLERLETRTYQVDLTGNLTGVTGVRVYPMIRTASGAEIVSGKYDGFGSGF